MRSCFLCANISAILARLQASFVLLGENVNQTQIAPKTGNHSTAAASVACLTATFFWVLVRCGLRLSWHMAAAVGDNSKPTNPAAVPEAPRGKHPTGDETENVSFIPDPQILCGVGAEFRKIPKTILQN